MPERITSYLSLAAFLAETTQLRWKVVARLETMSEAEQEQLERAGCLTHPWLMAVTAFVQGDVATCGIRAGETERGWLRAEESTGCEVFDESPRFNEAAPNDSDTKDRFRRAN